MWSSPGLTVQHQEHGGMSWAGLGECHGQQGGIAPRRGHRAHLGQFLCQQSRGWIRCVATSMLRQLKCSSGAQLCLCLCILSPL